MPDTPRPDPPDDSGDYVAVEELANWRITEGLRCRWGAGSKGGACGQASVVELNRRRWSARRGQYTEMWWAYCPDHMYGRWIKDGKIYSWVRVGGR